MFVALRHIVTAAIVSRGRGDLATLCYIKPLVLIATQQCFRYSGNCLLHPPWWIAARAPGARAIFLCADGSRVSPWTESRLPYPLLLRVSFRTACPVATPLDFPAGVLSGASESAPRGWPIFPKARARSRGCRQQVQNHALYVAILVQMRRSLSYKRFGGTRTVHAIPLH